MKQKILFICTISLLSWSLQAKPKISGALQTTVVTNNPESRKLDIAKTNGRFYQNAILNVRDIVKNKLDFHLNTRAAYRTNELEAREKVDLNFYSGYFDYRPVKNLDMQLGRIIDINNLGYSYYDGADVNYYLPQQKLEFGLYGGLLLDNDYINQEANSFSFNGFDYRNIATAGRQGDYIEGLNVAYDLKDVVRVNGELQMTQNNSKMAEQNAALEFETGNFAKKVQIYGYGSLDLIKVSPKETLIGARLQFYSPLVLFVEHEYIRPQFIKDSFWWMFKPHGSQEGSLKALYLINKKMSVYVKYGALFYDGASGEIGHDATAGYEDTNFYKFKLNVDMTLISGPLGNKYSLRGSGARNVRYFDALFGAGLSLYNESEFETTLTSGYFLFAGGKKYIIRNLQAYLLFEAFSNAKYFYDIRSLLKVTYAF